MDFRFAGFISVSLLAHLALLAIPASPTTVPQHGGVSSALRVSLLAVADAAAPAVTPTPTAAAAGESPHADTRRERERLAARPAPSRPAYTPTSGSHQDTAVPLQAVAASRAVPATPSASQVSERLSVALQRELAAEFSYPWLARKRGWQGRVTLSLHIAENGDLSRWEIATTSGYPLLDHSALDNARRIQRLPEAVGLLNGTTLDLLVPVHYRLLDS